MLGDFDGEEQERRVAIARISRNMVSLCRK
jgi:hypothetical protein